ncbi:MAG: hypothetical protein ABIS47_13840 [Acidimicrobiales bacterium]
MTEPAWDVREEGSWYMVTARATCPLCGQAFEERSQRRRAAGPPDTPPLSVRVAADGTVELAAAGFFLPVVTHCCAS